MPPISKFLHFQLRLWLFFSASLCFWISFSDVLRSVCSDAHRSLQQIAVRSDLNSYLSPAQSIPILFLDIFVFGGVILVLGFVMIRICEEAETWGFFFFLMSLIVFRLGARIRVFGSEFDFLSRVFIWIKWISQCFSQSGWWSVGIEFRFFIVVASRCSIFTILSALSSFRHYAWKIRNIWLDDGKEPYFGNYSTFYLRLFSSTPSCSDLGTLNSALCFISFLCIFTLWA